LADAYNTNRWETLRWSEEEEERDVEVAALIRTVWNLIDGVFAVLCASFYIDFLIRLVCRS
jgi:hypothetical protein